MTFSIMTLSLKGFFEALNINNTQPKTLCIERQSAECKMLSITIMLNAVMMSVIILRVVEPFK